LARIAYGPGSKTHAAGAFSCLFRTRICRLGKALSELFFTILYIAKTMSDIIQTMSDFV